MHLILSALVALLLIGCSNSSTAQISPRPQEPVVGLPCEGCDAVFQGLPDDLSSVAQLVGDDEPGERLFIRGTVTDLNGSPASGIIVYAYQTDAEGIYPEDPRFEGQSAHRHGRLRGWALTDSTGSYGFDTIRPASYPGTSIPQHVHMHILEPGRCTYYIDDILFDDDPNLTANQRRQLVTGRGGPGVVVPRRDADDRWVVVRDIVLGQGVPNYPS